MELHAEPDVELPEEAFAAGVTKISCAADYSDAVSSDLEALDLNRSATKDSILLRNDGKGYVFSVESNLAPTTEQSNLIACVRIDNLSVNVEVSVPVSVRSVRREDTVRRVYPER